MNTMSIATKTGDKGETSLIGGCRIIKNDIRIETYGTVDELNASIGVALAYAKNKTVVETLSKVQHHLFTIGAEIAALTPKKLDMKLPKTEAMHVEFLDSVLHPTEKSLPQQKEFILPNGTESGAHLHLARTICRRTERTLIACREKYDVNPEAIKYLNRLSDLLFLFARLENLGKVKETGVQYD